jgi:2-keto-4-pentenoate hydratase/2-oxohepta-3-ene-1,7-dioic acid hydratase in catechol pathway
VRLFSFRGDDDLVRVGRLDEDDRVVESPDWPDDLSGAFADSIEDFLVELEETLEPDGLGLASLRPAPALPVPGKVICIGLNYRDHCEEQNLPLPDRPLMFSKFANAVIADAEPIVRPPGTQALDLEVELGVVIGRRARRVRRQDAMDHVAGYVALNDVTARDWQGNEAALGEGEKGDGQWLRAKSSDTFLPMSSTFVTADEVPDPSDVRLRSWRIPGDGPDAGRPILMQDGTTANMIFDIPALIEFISAAITLEPGDVIATGTPSGVGVFRDPPVFLEPGDAVRVEVEGVGAIENPIIDWTEDSADSTAAGAERAGLAGRHATG